VSTQVASEFEAESEPAMYGSATEAIAVSSTSIKVGSMTDTVTSQGLTPWVSG